MRDALDKRVEELLFYVEYPTKPYLAKAFQLLKQPLEFSDSVVANAGKLHQVPLARLEITITQLVEELDTALAEMEEEMKDLNYQSSSGEEQEQGDDWLF